MQITACDIADVKLSDARNIGNGRGYFAGTLHADLVEKHVGTWACDPAIAIAWPAIAEPDTRSAQAVSAPPVQTERAR